MTPEQILSEIHQAGKNVDWTKLNFAELWEKVHVLTKIRYPEIKDVYLTQDIRKGLLSIVNRLVQLRQTQAVKDQIAAFCKGSPDTYNQTSQNIEGKQFLELSFVVYFLTNGGIRSRAALAAASALGNAFYKAYKEHNADGNYAEGCYWNDIAMLCAAKENNAPNSTEDDWVLVQAADEGEGANNDVAENAEILLLSMVAPHVRSSEMHDANTKNGEMYPLPSVAEHLMQGVELKQAIHAKEEKLQKAGREAAEREAARKLLAEQIANVRETDAFTQMRKELCEVTGANSFHSNGTLFIGSQTSSSRQKIIGLFNRMADETVDPLAFITTLTKFQGAVGDYLKSKKHPLNVAVKNFIAEYKRLISSTPIAMAVETPVSKP